MKLQYVSDLHLEFPENNTLIVNVNKKDLLAVLSKASIFCNQTTKMVIFEVKENCLTLTAKDVDFEKYFTGEMKANIQGFSEPIAIGLNHTLLSTILKAITSKEIKLSFSDGNNPVLVNDNSLLMPMFI